MTSPCRKTRTGPSPPVSAYSMGPADSAISGMADRPCTTRASCPPPSPVREAGPDGRGRRGVVRRLGELDAGHPLDPLEAATARGHQPRGGAVAMGEGLAVHP